MLDNSELRGHIKYSKDIEAVDAFFATLLPRFRPTIRTDISLVQLLGLLAEAFELLDAEIRDCGLYIPLAIENSEYEVAYRHFILDHLKGDCQCN